MKYFIIGLLLTGCSEPFDLSRVKAEAKHTVFRHKIVAVTKGNVTTYTVELKDGEKP